MDTDASNVSLGAVLSNVVDGVEHALVYSSRILSKTEAMYSTTKREALAVVQALKWFKPYIWGLKFVVRTDHASLRWLFRQNADGMTFRMLQVLQEFEFEVVHRAGNKHANADGLSRMIEEEPEWRPGEKEELMGDCPEPCSLENALSRLKDQCCVVNAVSASDDNLTDAVVWERAEPDVRKMQREDNSMSWIFYWTGIAEDATMSSLGTNLI